MQDFIEFGRLLGPLRRAVTKQVRSATTLPELPDAQIELLRVVAEAGVMTPGDAAARLRVAPSTVSNLVRALMAEQLLERIPSATDLRTVTLKASATALDALRRYDLSAGAALERALDQMSPEHRQALAAALPALKVLCSVLEQAPPGTNPVPVSRRYTSMGIRKDELK